MKHSPKWLFILKKNKFFTIDTYSLQCYESSDYDKSVTSLHKELNYYLHVIELMLNMA